MMISSRFAAGLVALGACCPLPTAVAATVQGGTHMLLPNTSGQQVPIMVTGGEAVSGVDLFVQVGDGGATVGGVDTGPIITQLDLVTGAIFAANHTEIFTDPAPLIWGATTTTASGFVTANGRLAMLTIDTTGITSGQFALILNPPSTGPTAFADPGVTTMLIHGTLQVGTSLIGDYNKNEFVDAADYTVWRNTIGQTGPNLPADGNGNQEIDSGDYDVWKTNFGQSLAGGASRTSIVPVPEPANWILAVVNWAAASTMLRLVRVEKKTAERYETIPLVEGEPAILAVFAYLDSGRSS
jgi:hypothetical protein